MGDVASVLPEFELLLGGEMSTLERGQLLEVAKDSGVKVRTLGFVDDAHLRGLYGAASLFVYPSLAEGFGLQILEAMACGCPVVTSCSTSLGEVAGDAAILVNPESSLEVATGGLKMLSDSSLRAHYVQVGIARAREFSWDRCARETLDVYDRVLAAF